MDPNKITHHQFIILVMLFTIGSNILDAPFVITNVANQSGWLAGILGWGVGILLVWLYSTVAQQFPKQTFIEYSQAVLGKALGNALNLFYVIYYFFLSSVMVGLIISFLNLQILPRTPMEVIGISFLLIAITGVHYGLGVIGRSAEIFFPWISTFLCLMFILLLPQINLSHLTPILDGGVRPIFRAAFTFLGLPFLELPIFLMIIPYVDNQKHIKKCFLLGTLLGGLVLVSTIFLCILVLGAQLTSLNQYPSYQLGKEISIGNFIQRIEVMVAIIWILTIFYKLSICLFVTSHGLSKLLHLKEQRSVLLPLILIISVITRIISPNQSFYDQFIRYYWAPASLPIGLGIPLLLLIVGRLRKKSIAL
ncbi:germination protein GerKB [Pullulanibacillus camelliae]|uniref:Germination protein GerKB n=1 Tax=Pullulanibacillus camelliae TaxID=1707096 RepID=A0A8J2VN59_9BACL|nr:endospore germination permease [Pullulanibacillus camelliae]GGE33514.1 germination protein GerKB [Pullulanibacillus camelliae]